MATAPRFMTPEEYLAEELQAEFRHEYRDGQVFEMPGGTLNHNRITRSLLFELQNAISGTACEIFFNDVRAAVPSHRLYTYPDLVVIDGPPETLAGSETVMNPVLLIEVLSDSTRNYDRGQKFELYKTIPSLREYVTVAQDQVLVEQWNRMESGWRLTKLDSLEDQVRFGSIPAVVGLRVIYAGIDFAR